MAQSNLGLQVEITGKQMKKENKYLPLFICGHCTKASGASNYYFI